MADAQRMVTIPWHQPHPALTEHQLWPSAGVIKIMDLEVGSVSWIIQGGPVCHMSPRR